MFLPDPVVHAALDALFAGGPTRWLLLSETEPVLATDGYTGVTEPTATSYHRIEILAADWPAADGRAVELTVAWPDTVDDLGVLPFWGLADAPTAGAVRVAGKFASPLSLPAGTSNITATLRIEAPASFTVLA